MKCAKKEINKTWKEKKKIIKSWRNPENKIKKAIIILKILEKIKSNPLMENKEIGIITMNSRQEAYIEELISSYESSNRGFSFC